MAASAAVIAAKAAIAVVSDKRARTLILSIIVGVIAGIVIIIGTLFSVMKGSQDSNQRALGYIFNTQPVEISMWDIPAEYRDELVSAKGRVASVMSAVDAINAGIEGTEVNSLKAGSIYLCLFPNGESTNYSGFVDCFVTKGTVTETVDGEEVTREVTTAISDESTIYTNIRNKFGIAVSPEQMSNITKTYTFLTTGGIFTAPFENTGPPGEAYNDETFARLMDEATKYIGYPYVWGGSTPQTSFDCSGYVCWVYTKSGVYNLPRTTAWEIFKQCTVVPKSELKPGDLVFFQGTYDCPNPTSHIGIYVGENKMLHCGNPIGYASIDSTYWAEHWYAGGRLN